MRTGNILVFGLSVFFGACVTEPVFKGDNYAFIRSNYPIVSINGLPLGSGKVGPVTRRLMDAWQELVGMDFVAQGLSHLPEDERARLTEQWKALAV